MRNKKIDWPWLWAFVLCFICALVLFSCDCNYHLKKALGKCGLEHLRDTIRIHDTIETPGVKADTVFKPGRDTVIIKEGKLTMKYFYNNRDTTIYLQGKCDPERIPYYVEVPVDTTKLNFDFMQWIKQNLLFVALLLAVLYYLLIKKPANNETKK